MTVTAARLPPRPAERAEFPGEPSLAGTHLLGPRGSDACRVISSRYNLSLCWTWRSWGCSESDLHGYEIRRQLRENLGLLANVSFGSIYPALTRLEKAGAVVAVEGDRRTTLRASPSPPRPPDRSAASWPCCGRDGTPHTRARRGRKAYRITDHGRQLFAELLSGGGTADDARSFSLRLAFARHLAPQARLALLERRRAQLVQRLAEADEARDDLDVYARTVVQHTADVLARDINWLDTLIASERAALVVTGSESKN